MKRIGDANRWRRTAGRAIALADRHRSPNRRCQGRAKLMAAAAILLSDAAYARQEQGPTSSASAEISVSIASRYQLSAPATTLVGPGDAWLCFATNSEAPTLPVTLIRALDRGTERQAASMEDTGPELVIGKGIVPCASVDAIGGSRKDAAEGLSGNMLLLVHPE
jgi:hypothetical protein